MIAMLQLTFKVLWKGSLISFLSVYSIGLEFAFVEKIEGRVSRWCLALKADPLRSLHVGGPASMSVLVYWTCCIQQ